MDSIFQMVFVKFIDMQLKKKLTPEYNPDLLLDGI